MVVAECPAAPEPATTELADAADGAAMPVPGVDFEDAPDRLARACGWLLIGTMNAGPC